MAYSTINYSFNPFGFVDSHDVPYLSGLFNSQGIVSKFELQAHRRRGAWGSTLPMGVFDNEFRAGHSSWEQHLASRSRITTLAEAAMKEPGKKPRRAIARRLDVLERDGVLYYHPEALRTYARHVDHPAFLTALARFLEAADKNPSLLRSDASAAPFIPHAERAKVYGFIARGPSWDASEDAVLRRWFGQRSVGEHSGHHVKLTEEEWSRVLAELPRRNRNGVRNRLVELNKALKPEFFRGGFVSVDKLPEYMARVLGERPRVPVRPQFTRRVRATL